MANSKKLNFLLVTLDEEMEKKYADSLKSKFKYCLILPSRLPADAIHKLNHGNPDLIIMDMTEGEYENNRLLQRCAKVDEFKKIPIVALVDEVPKDHNSPKNLIFFVIDQNEAKFWETIQDALRAKQSDKHPQKSFSKVLKKGERLITEGEISGEIYMVKSGKFRVFKNGKDGKEINLGEIVQNELVGELSFIDEKPRSATVEAMEETVCVGLPIKAFNEYVEGQEIWVKAIIKTLVGRLRNADKKILS